MKENFENLPIDEINWPYEGIPASGVFQTSPPIWTAIPVLPKERFLKRNQTVKARCRT